MQVKRLAFQVMFISKGKVYKKRNRSYWIKQSQLHDKEINIIVVDDHNEWLSNHEMPAMLAPGRLQCWLLTVLTVLSSNMVSYSVQLLGCEESKGAYMSVSMRPVASASCWMSTVGPTHKGHPGPWKRSSIVFHYHLPF